MTEMNMEDIDALCQEIVKNIKNLRKVLVKNSQKKKKEYKVTNENLGKNCLICGSSVVRSVNNCLQCLCCHRYFISSEKSINE